MHRIPPHTTRLPRRDVSILEQMEVTRHCEDTAGSMLVVLAVLLVEEADEYRRWLQWPRLKACVHLTSSVMLDFRGKSQRICTS